MKTCKPHFILLSLASFGLLLAGSVTAQTFTTLHHFAGSDGANPYGALIQSGNMLYGTTYGGGSGGAGTVFRITTEGAVFTNLHSFAATSGPLSTNSDGANPYAELVLSGNTLYGTTPYGGGNGKGTVFKLNTDGSGFSVLHTFLLPDHGEPYGGLILSGETLYGVAGDGGSFGWGSVFAIKTNGTDFTNLHSFTYGTNDASSPHAALVLSGNSLYGTTTFGGSLPYAYNGCVFKVNTDGTGYTNVYNFSGSDGSGPQSALVLAGNTLYGTTVFGGSDNYGVVFKVNTDGTGFASLHSFVGGWNEAYPFAGLALSGNVLYGTAYMGGNANKGTVFKINTDGSGFTNLHQFAGAGDGANPRAAVMVSGSTLYGTTSAGGSSGKGTVFRIALPLPPQLTITRSGTNVVLAWPADAAGFTLESATNLDAPGTWTTVSPPPVVIDGNNTVTNPISGGQMFYRLRR